MLDVWPGATGSQWPFNTGICNWENAANRAVHREKDAKWQDRLEVCSIFARRCSKFIYKSAQISLSNNINASSSLQKKYARLTELFYQDFYAKEPLWLKRYRVPLCVSKMHLFRCITRLQINTFNCKKMFLSFTP